MTDECWQIRASVGKQSRETTDVARSDLWSEGTNLWRVIDVSFKGLNSYSCVVNEWLTPTKEKKLLIVEMYLAINDHLSQSASPDK